MTANCPLCKLGRNFISDNRDYPRLIENGKIIIPNHHRFYHLSLIECNNCNALWLFRGEPADDNNPAKGFYYPVNQAAFKNLSHVSFNDFIDFCISEFHNYKVGKFIDEKIAEYLKCDEKNVYHVLQTKREIPPFILDILLEWYKGKNNGNL